MSSDSALQRIQDGKLTLPDPTTGEDTVFEVGADPVNHRKRSPVHEDTLRWFEAIEDDSKLLLSKAEAAVEADRQQSVPEAVQPPEGSFPNPVPAEQAVHEQEASKRTD